MSDDPQDKRKELHEKLTSSGQLEEIEVELLIELAEQGGAPDESEVPGGAIGAEGLFTDSVMMTLSRSGKTGAMPIALVTDDDDDDDDDERPYQASGARLAIAHLSNGLVVRGLVEDFSQVEDGVKLDDSKGAGGRTRDLGTKDIHTLHLMLPADMAHPPREGREARVTLRNGTTLEGLLPGYNDKLKAFSLLPKGDKYMDRIIVYRHVVADITFV